MAEELANLTLSSNTTLMSTLQDWLTMNESHWVSAVWTQWWRQGFYPSLQDSTASLLLTLCTWYQQVTGWVVVTVTAMPWQVLLRQVQEHFFAILLASVVLALTTYYHTRPSPTQQYKQQLQYCWKDLCAFCASSNLHPVFLRLAWSDCADYDRSIPDWPYCGGANGSIRFDSDLQDGSNAGLAMAIAMLSPFKQKYPKVSWADLIQMSAVASVHTAQGPLIKLNYGRVDVPIDIRDMNEHQEERYRKIWKPKGPTKVSSDDMLRRFFPKVFPPYPLGEQNAAIHLRIFFHRLGLSSQEAVALCGGHTIGRAFKDRTGACPFASGDQGATMYTKSTSGPESMKIKQGMAGGGSWTKNWLVFDNSYFRRPFEEEDGAKNPHLIWLPSDQALLEDSEYQQFFAIYAKDQNRFFEEFERAFHKISELGAKFQFQVQIDEK